MSNVLEFRTEEQIAAHIKRQKAYLSRRKNSRGYPYKYRAHGGPFDGLDLWLRTESTAQVIIGQHRGRYVVQRQDYRVVGDKDKLVWEEA